MADFVAQSQQFQAPAADPGTARISGRVWDDANGNGLQDAGERSLAYQSLYVYGYADDKTYMIGTDGFGNYQVSGLIAGGYYLQFNRPYNGVFTAQGVGHDPALDSDADASGRVDTFQLAAGEQRDTVDVGMVLTDMHDASINGRAWFDGDANGQFGYGEEFMMPGVGVTLHDAGADGLLGTGDDSTQRTVTDGTGRYAFYELSAGRYQVVFDEPTGYRFTEQDVPTESEAWNSDVDARGVAPVIDLAMGDHVSAVADAGFMRPDGYDASVNGKAWNDYPGNGSQEPWAPGLWQIRVYLYSYVDGSTQTTLTDFDGNYTFFGLAPGEYYLLFERRPGYAFTATNAGEDDTLDSDADSAGYVAAFTLAAGEQLHSVDAGQIYIDTRSASVADRAWHDANANGVQDAGETGVADMRVYLYSYTDGSTAVTFTDAQGAYRFDDLAAGEYYLLFEGLDGHGFTAAGQGLDAAHDSDVRASGHSPAFDLGVGEQHTGIAAGLVVLPGAASLPPLASLLEADGRVFDLAPSDAGWPAAGAWQGHASVAQAEAFGAAAAQMERELAASALA